MKQTLTCISVSFLIALIITLPSVDFLYGMNWKISDTPLNYLSLGMRYTDTFFHEIFHTLTGWFYGYPALPSFDLQHGGGMTYYLKRSYLLIGLLYCVISAGIYFFKENRAMQILLASIAVFHLATAYNNSHDVIMTYMGHGGVFVLSLFFLHRAWMDDAPRGTMERYLNAIIGFGMLFKNIILFWGLMFNDVVKNFYHNQKGTHAFGDLSRVAADTPFNMAQVAGFSLFLCLIAMIIPAILYLRESQYGCNDLDPKGE